MGSSTPNKACIFCGSVDNVILVNNERCENMPVCRRCVDQHNTEAIKQKIGKLINFCNALICSIESNAQDVVDISKRLAEISRGIDRLSLNASKEPENGENPAQDSHGKDDKSSEESIIS